MGNQFKPAICWNRFFFGFLLCLVWGTSGCWVRGDSDLNVKTASAIVLTPDAVPADGQTRMQVTVKFGNALLVSAKNLRVTLSSDFEPAQIIQPTPPNAQGEAVGYIYSAQMGRATLRAHVVLNGQDILLDAEAVATFTDPLIALQIQLSLSATDSPATVGGSQGIGLTAVAVDVDGAPVAQQAIEFTSSDPNDEFTATSVFTDSMGMATTQVRSNFSGSRNISAKLDYAQVSVPIVFKPDTADSHTSYIALTLAQIYADGSHATTAKVIATDQYNNPIAGVLVNLVSSDSGDNIVPSSVYTDSQGCAYFQITATSAGTHTLTATMQAVSVSTHVEVLVPEPSAAQSFVSVSPTVQTADGGSSVTVTTHVRDPIGVNLPGVAVTLNASGQSNSFGSASGVTDANGIFVTTLTSQKAETKVITAQLPNTSLNTSVTFVPGAPSTATSVLTLSPAVVLANGVAHSTVTVIAKDSSGNVIPNHPVTLSSTGTNNTLAQATGTTNASGIFTATWASTKAETKTLTATLGGIYLQQSAQFTADTAHVSATLTALAQDTVADGSSTNTLTVKLVDANNNPVAGAAVSFIVADDNTFSPQSGVTDVNGRFVAAVSSTSAGDHTITVNAGGTSASTQVPFVAGTPSSAQSALVANPTGNITADGSATTTLTLTVLDAYDNPIAGEAVSLTSSGTGNTFGATSGTTNSSGIFTTTLKSTVAETKTITANFATASVQTQATFVSGHANLSQSSLTASPTSTTADGSSQISFVLTVLDGQGNAVPNASVTLTTNGQNDSFAPASTGTTGDDGTLSFTLVSTHAETKTVSASVDGIVLNRTVTFSAGAPNQSHSSLTVSPSSVAADNSSVANIVLTVRDIHDNPIPNVAVTLSTSGASSDTLTQISSQTNASGVVSATLASQLAQTDTITASFASLTLSTTVQFIASAPSASESTLTASPTSLTADGTSSSALTFTVKDQFGNPTPNVTVNFSITNGNGATLATQTGTTNSSGVFTTSLTSTVANDVTVQAQTNGGSVTQSVVVHCVAGQPSTSTSSFSASPSEVVADDQALITLSMIWRDAQGNVIPNQSWSLSSPQGQDTFSASSGNADGSGAANTTLHSTLSGTRNITASAGMVSMTTPVTFDPGNPNTTQSTLVASPDNVTADGTSTTTIQLTLRDAFNNVVPNVTSNITSSGSNNTITPASQSTDSTGVATFTLSSSTAETKNLVGHGNTATPTTSMTFVPGGVSTALSSIVANPNTQKAGSPIALLVTAEDAQGNLIANQSVSLTGLGTNNAFVPASGTTDANGTFSSTLVSTKVQTETIRAVMDGKNVQTSVNIYASDPNATNSTWTAASSTATADGSTPIALTLTLKDDYGNPIPGYSTSFSTDGSASTFTPASGTTNSSGVFNSNVTSSLAQNENAIATAGSLSLQTPIQFTAGQASSLVFTTSPNSTTVSDGANVITYLLTAKDGSGNPITNQSVSFRRSTDASAFTTQTSNSSGQASVSISSKTAGDVTIISTIQGMNASATGTFVPADPNGDQSTFSANPNAVTADGTSQSNLVFTALDVYANPIPNLSVSFSVTGSNNVLSANSATTDASGKALVTLASTTSEVKTAQGQLGSITKNAPVTFLASTPNQTLSTMLINPNSVVADGSTTETITVTLKDDYGNLVSGQTVNLAASGGNNTLSPVSGTSNSSGVFTSTLASTLAQTQNVTASFAGKSLTQVSQFVPGAPDASKTTFVASPNTAVANGSQAVALVLTVRDAFGNPISGQGASFTYNGANTTLSPASGSSSASGTLNVSAVSTQAQNENIRASLTSTSIYLDAPISFTPGNSNVTNTTFSANPNSVTADGSTQSTLTITVRDDYMNPIPNKAVSISSDGTNNNFSSSSGSTDSTGTWTTSLASTKAQLKNVTANYDSKNSTTQVTFVAGSPNSVLSSFTINPNQVTADGSSTATLTTTLKDAFSNPVTSTSVSYSANGTSNTFGAASGTTDTTGVYTTTLASTLAQQEAIQSNAASGVLVQNGNIVFVADSPSSSTSKIVANPNQNITADGNSTSQLTVTVTDAHNNPVPNQSVTLSANGSNNTFSPTSFATDSNGMGTATLASTVAQTKTVTATFGSASTSTPVTFIAGAPASSTSTWTANPNSLTADGNSQTTLTLTVRDINNNVVKNQSVTYTSTGSGNAFSSNSGSTSSSGVATTTMTSTKAENKTITATFGSVSLNVAVSFQSGAVSASKSTLIANPNSLTADGSSTSQLTVTALDAYSNPVANLSIALSGNGNSNVFSATSGTTNASGQFLATLKSTYAQSETLTATLGSGGTPPTATAGITFTPGPSDANKSSFVINPTTVVADNVTTTSMTVTARDTYSNVIPNASVSMSSTGSNNTITNPNGTTDPNGVYTTTLKSSKAEAKTVTVSITP